MVLRHPFPTRRSSAFVLSSVVSSSPVWPPPLLVLFFSALAASSSLGLFPLQMIAMRWPSGDQVAVPTVSPSLHGCIVRACLLCKFRIASSLVFSWEIRYSRRRQSGDQMGLSREAF